MLSPVARGVVVLLLVVGTGAVSAAQQSTPGAFVDVSAKPTVALVGQPVTISGSTGYHEKTNVATVLVKHESGAPSTTLTATVSPKGEFSVTFTDTKKAGKYKVTVTAPDGTGKGETQFRVDSVETLVDDVEQVATELDKRTNKLLAYIKNVATSWPPSNERTELLQKVQDLQAKKSSVQLPPVKVLGDLRKAMHGPTPVYVPDQQIVGELRDWVPKGQEAVETIDRSPIDERPAPICETIHTALEGAKFASYAFSIAESVPKTLMKIAIDKGISVGAGAVAGEGPLATGISAQLKVDVEVVKKEANVRSGLISAATDILEFIVGHVFEEYCSEYKGPVTAKMTMVWKEGVQPWMKYGVVLDGELRLRHSKEAPTGKPVYMTGEFEGNATNFSFWEDVTIASPLPRSVIVLQRLWLPPVAFVNSPKSLNALGQVVRMGTPSYFDVPVIAEMSGDAVKVQFKDARHDFSDAVKNRLLFVVYNGLYPDFKVFTFPIQKAHWILSKGLENPAMLTVTRDASGSRAIKVTKQNHKDSPDKSVNVDWTITIDVRGKAEQAK